MLVIKSKSCLIMSQIWGHINNNFADTSNTITEKINSLLWFNQDLLLGDLWLWQILGKYLLIFMLNQ